MEVGLVADRHRLNVEVDLQSIWDPCNAFALAYESANHRVGRVLSVSPVVAIGTPPPL